MAGFDAHAASGGYVADNTPSFVASAEKSAAAAPSTVLTLGLWLKPRNKATLDGIVAGLYDPTSPRYRHWLSRADVQAQFAPTAADSAAVRAFIRSSGLTLLAEGPDHFYFRVQGSVAEIEKSFHTQLNRYKAGNQVVRANASNPYIDGAAASLIAAVGGLSSAEMQRGTNIQPLAALSKGVVSDAAAAAAPAGFQSVCVQEPGIEKVATEGGYPKATYTGHRYNTTGAGCGYTPAQVQKAYGLSGLYTEGYNGKGQTIVLIEPCGSPTIRSDANAFSQAFGLPALTAANFTITSVPSPSACSGEYPVINGDVEWAHAIAPGANIAMIVPPTGFEEDVDEATYYAATEGLGNVISGSYFTPEFFTDKAEAQKENLIAELAASMGVSTNYASGDASNYTYEHTPPTVSVPADLPYATGVGGVTTALKPDGTLLFQTGWETHVALLKDDGTIYDPSSPLNFYGFAGGSGGGTSSFFAKPAYQKALAGTGRQVPDIAWLADSFTGGIIVVSQAQTYPNQVWYGYGGTELATAMFSGLWAIANQEAGTALGQAAPYLYRMPKPTITDIVEHLAAGNVTATVESAAGKSASFTPSETLAIADPGMFGSFFSAWGVDPSGIVFDVAFGQDYYLHQAVGWDPVTGLGAPNGKAFADWFRPAKS